MKRLSRTASSASLTPAAGARMRRKNPMMKDERTHMVAFGFLLYLRYVASEVNCADGPSRGGQVGAAEETKAHAD